jgi:hypothetical protein
VVVVAIVVPVAPQAVTPIHVELVIVLVTESVPLSIVKKVEQLVAVTFSQLSVVVTAVVIPVAEQAVTGEQVVVVIKFVVDPIVSTWAVTPVEQLVAVRVVQSLSSSSSSSFSSSSL